MRYDYIPETVISSACVGLYGDIETDERTVYRISDRCTRDTVADAYTLLAATRIVDALNASASAAAR
jgi:hypothetical protein